MKKLKLLFLALFCISIAHSADAGAGVDLDLQRALEESIKMAEEEAELAEALRLSLVEQAPELVAFAAPTEDSEAAAAAALPDTRHDRMLALIEEYKAIDATISQETIKCGILDPFKFEKLKKENPAYATRLWLCTCLHEENRITLSERIIEAIERTHSPEKTLTYYSLGSGELLQDALVLTELVLLGYSLEIYLQDPLLFEGHIKLLEDLLNSRKTDDQNITLHSGYAALDRFIEAGRTFDVIVAIDPDTKEIEKMRTVFEERKKHLTPGTGIDVWAINAERNPHGRFRGISYTINGAEYSLKEPAFCKVIPETRTEPSKPKDKKKPKDTKKKREWWQY